MTVEEIRMAFAKNLKSLMDSHQYNQEDIARICGTSRQIVSEWLNGRKYPRMDKVQAILDHFGIPLNALIGDGKTDAPYYLNPETVRIAQELHDNPQFRVMFDATKDLDPESVQKIIDFIKYQRHLEGYDE